MRCSHCGRENPAEARFCRECGTPSVAVCPQCSAPTQPADSFCINCGLSLAAGAGPQSPVPGGMRSGTEKRFVSVLFADIVAYTSIAENRDPDEVHDLLTIYYDRSRSIIEKFGGFVDKFIGDAVMGVWGAEIIREDDAERAVRAGLELVSMVADLGEEQGLGDLRLRVGVNSGSTSVGPGGNEQGLVVGDLVNVASRLQSAAQPDSVYVGASTHAVTYLSIVYEERATFEVKGKVEAVEAWRAVRPTGRLGAGPADREFPFTGRHREMRILKDLLEVTGTEQRARLVAVTGEAGIGKSRLASEFMNHVDGFAEPVFWHQGRSPSFGEGLPMWAAGEMIRQRAGIVDDADPDQATEQLRSCVARFVPGDADRQWIEGWFLGLLGLADMPFGPGTEMHSAIRTFFQNIATRGTTVLVFEDLHWGDPSLIEFVVDLVDRSTMSPILVIALARPEILQRFAGFASNQRSSMAIGLAPLVHAEMTAMLTEHLPGVEGALIDQIVHRASGFPLYAAEIVRMLTNSRSLVESEGHWQFHGDVEAMAIPDTLQAVIEARLDRLSPELRGLLQDAAILGVTCTRAGLEAVSGKADLDAALAKLEDLEILRVEDDPRSPDRGQYRFVQGLIQEVAYRRLHRTNRRSRHLLAAEYFRSLDDPELAGLISAHLQRAFKASPAGQLRNEIEGRNLDALVEAAGRSAQLHSHHLAMDLYDDALALSSVGAQSAKWLLQAVKSATQGGAVARGLLYLDRADRLYGESGDLDGLRRSVTLRSSLLNSWFDSAGALAAIELFYRELDEIGDPVSLGIAAETARSLALCQRLAEAVTVADRAIPIAEALDRTDITVELVITRATALTYEGRFVEGVSALRGVLEVCQQQGLLESARRAMNNLLVGTAKHNPVEWSALTPRFLELCERIGGAKWVNRACQYVAWAAREIGDWDENGYWLERADQPMSDPLWSHIIAYQRESSAAARGVDGAAERLLTMCDSMDNDDPLWHGLLDIYRAFAFEMLGDWQNAYERGLAAGRYYYEGLRTCVRAAARIGDVALIKEPDAMVDHVAFGPLRSDTHAMFEGVRLGLSGDAVASTATFVRLLAAMDGVETPQAIAAVQALFGQVVGRQEPSAELATSEATRWLTETGSLGYLKAYVGSDVVGLPAAR